MSLAVGGGLVVAPGATASRPPVKISFVQYDSPGRDTGSNASLNSEYVLITNTTTTNRALTGWTLRDKAAHIYRFPAFVLKAKASVYVRTGKGIATASNRYYNLAWYVWNNTGDTAYLRDGRGVLQYSCTWTSRGLGYRSC
jgi:hypothetical protein